MGGDILATGVLRFNDQPVPMEIDDPDYSMDDEPSQETVLYTEDPMDVDDAL